MSPIKGLTERNRLPRIGKIHLGIKKEKKNKQGQVITTYPSAVDYFVYPAPDAPGGELLEQLIETFGEQPKELRIIFPLEDEETIASQYYRCYTRTRGLVCRGDGEICMRLVDKVTGDLPSKDSKNTEMREMACQGRECPDYQSGNCREIMNLQFILPEISGLGIWQIDTSSVNSITNINNCLKLVRSIYGRVSIVPLLLTLEKMEVIPPGGTKKNVFVLNIRSNDNMIEAAIKARKPPLELIAGPPDMAQVEADTELLYGDIKQWPADEKDRMLTKEEAAERMTPEEIEGAKEEEEKLEPPDETCATDEELRQMEREATAKSKPEPKEDYPPKLDYPPDGSGKELKLQNSVKSLKETMQDCNWSATDVGQYCNATMKWNIKDYNDLDEEKLAELIEHIKENPK